MTDFLGMGIGAFYYHKKSEAEGGYNYYGRIHRMGQVLIQREEIATGNMTYALGIDFDTSWTNRVSLTYKNIDKL